MSSVPSPEPDQADYARSSALSPTASSTGSGHSPNCHCGEGAAAVEHALLDVVVRKADFNRSLSSEVGAVPTYEMSARPRGKALIIEIEKYDNDVQERRIGSQVRTTQL